MRCRIHVNRHLIAANARDGGSRPVYTIKRAGTVTYAHGVRITGTVQLPDPRVTPPLSCGARAWIDVIDGEVTLIEPCSYQEALSHAA